MAKAASTNKQRRNLGEQTAHPATNGGTMTLRLNTERKGVSILWDVAPGDEGKTVTVYATGEEGDVHNKVPQANSGEAGLFYPADFSGSSHVEVRDDAGNVLAEGDISL